MITIYGGGRSRWVKVLWLLREMNIPFESYDIFVDSNSRTRLENLNPACKVPTLVDSGFVLSESTAIINYLCDKYPDKKLCPEPGTKERAIYDQWMAFATSDLEQPLWRLLRHKFIYHKNDRSEDDIRLARKDFRAIADILENTVKDHLVGNRFSAADLVVAWTLNWATWFDLLKGYPKLQAYKNLHTSRVSFPLELSESFLNQ